MVRRPIPIWITTFDKLVRPQYSRVVIAQPHRELRGQPTDDQWPLSDSFQMSRWLGYHHRPYQPSIHYTIRHIHLYMYMYVDTTKSILCSPAFDIKSSRLMPAYNCSTCTLQPICCYAIHGISHTQYSPLVELKRSGRELELPRIKKSKQTKHYFFVAKLCDV